MARGKGEGGLTYDKTMGIWRASIELPATVEHGQLKRRRKVVSSKDKRKAMQKLREAQKDLSTLGDLANRSVTVEEWVKRWLTEIGPKERTPSTMASYRAALNNHVVPRIGKRKLDKVTPAIVRQILTEVAADPKTGEPDKRTGTARNLHSYMSACFTDALTEGLITSNPVKHVKAPRARRKTAAALTVDQGVHLLQHLSQRLDKGDRLAGLWIAYLLTGARRGELLGLEADRVEDEILDVCWQLRQITDRDIAGAPVDYDYRHMSGTLYLVRPKSKAGWRAYPLVEPLRGVMHRLRRESPGGLLFTREDGKPWPPGDISELWKQLLIDAGLSDTGVTLHGARHTVVDLLYIAEVPEHLISEIVGHSSRQVTRGYKSQHGPALRKAMEDMSKLLAPSA